MLRICCILALSALCASQPVDQKPVEPKLVEPKPVQPIPVEPKPVQPKIAEPKPVQPKVAEPKPVQPKIAEPKPVQPKLVEPKSSEPKLPILKEVPFEVIFRVPDKKELVLKCATVQSDDRVKYSWIKDGKPFSLRADVKQQEKEGTLIFKKPVDSDEGQYQCMAQSEFGVATTRTINVKKSFIEKPKMELKKHKPVEGKTYQLDCNIPKSYPKPEIIWAIKTGDKFKQVEGAKFTISPEGTLYFASVTKEDVGADKTYVCHGKTPASDDAVPLAEHVLEEVVPDSGPKDHEVVKQYVSTEVTAKVGESVFLYCIYGGDPLAHPDWFKDDQDVNNGPKDRVTRHNKSVGKRLIIKDVWATDEGEYTCSVNNEIGKVQKSTMHLKVVSAPKLLKNAVPKMMVKAGEDVTIPCQMTGTPLPKLTWTRNTEALPTRAVLKESSQGNLSISDMSIHGVQKEDSGYFGCRGRNEYGETYMETLLYVL